MSIDKIQPLTVDIIDDNNLVETNTRRTFYSQDKETAIIKFQVRENGKEFDFSTLTDATASVAVRTADRSLFNLSATITNPTSGVVEVVIPQEVLMHEGKAEGELYIDSGAKRNATVQFSFKIKLSLIDKNNLDVPVIIEALDAIVERVITNNPEIFGDFVTEQEMIDYVAANGGSGEVDTTNLAPKVHTHTIGDITNLQISLDAKADKAYVDNTFLKKTDQVNVDLTAYRKVTDTVNYSDTDFITVGKNIFNNGDLQADKVVSHTTGIVNTSAGWMSNKMEPIQGGTTYTQSKSAPIAFYDYAGKFISGIATGTYASPRTFTTPTNARKYISSVDNSVALFYQIELGNTSTAFEKYKRTIKDVSVPLDDNSVTTSKIVDKNVTLDKLSVTKTGKNLFDKSRAILDKAVNQTTGVLYDDATKATTHVIQVTENTPYAFTQIDRIVYKDVNGKFISGEFVGNVIEMTRTTPAGATQMQVTFRKAVIDTFMVVQGTTTGVYENYRNVIPDANVESMPFVLGELGKGAKFPSVVSRTGDLIRFNYKYNATQDAIVEWRFNGANGLFDFYRISFVENTSNIVSSATSGTVAFTNTTDFFGPHTFLAKNDIDGTYPTGFNYTGGNHLLDGVKTARASSPVRLFVDGREVNGDFSGAGLNFEVTWTNRIQAHNTFKTDGTGREVMEQRFRLAFDGVKFNVYSEIEFLEDATYKLYHGLQSNHSNIWDGTVYFHNSPNRKKNDALTKQDSGDKRCNWITLEKGNHALDIFIDPDEGLGTKEFVSDSAVNGAFNMDTSKKTYFTLMSDTDFTTGDVLTLKGYYKFYSK